MTRRRRTHKLMTGAQIRAWRKAKDWTQAEAADALGLSLRQYTHYEYGTQGIPDTVALLVRCLQSREEKS